MPSNMIDHSGKTYGYISVGKITASYPKRKYSARCKHCGSSWNILHDTITTRINSGLTPECANNGCPTHTPIPGQQQREKDYFKNLKQREREEKEAIDEQRTRAKYNIPEPPKPAPKRSLEDLETEFKKTAYELALVERERITKGLHDPDFIPDPSFANASMPSNQVDTWNDKQAQIFMQNCPDYYATPENSEILLDYIESQGVKIISAETFTRAYRRLKQFNLLEEHPPEPEPVRSDPLPTSHEGYPNSPQTAQYIDGWDQDTGLPRQYTSYELDRLPSWELEKVLRIPRVRRIMP